MWRRRLIEFRVRCAKALGLRICPELATVGSLDGVTRFKIAMESTLHDLAAPTGTVGP